jgi:DNA repair protein RadC
MDRHYGVGHIKRLKNRFLEGKTSRNEIIELLLSYPIKGRDVKPQSKMIYSLSSGNFRKIFETVERSAIQGVGIETRLFFRLIRAFLDEYHKDNFIAKKFKASTQSDVIEYFRSACADMTNEAVYCVFLDAKNSITSLAMICEGTLTQSLLYPREIISRAIKTGSLSFILIHNHPSGDPSPSENDMKITKKMLFSAKDCDVLMLDHIIIGTQGKGYYSFYEEGIMEKYNNAYRSFMNESQKEL